MWNERYAEPGFAYGTLPNDFLVEVEPRLSRGARVLCLAEGEGRNVVWLATRGHTVTAMDGSSVGMAKAFRLANERGVTVTTQVSDLADLTIEPSAWDGIVSIWAHVPKPLREQIHRGVVSGLKPGGCFLLEAYTPLQIARGTGGPRDAELCMRASDVRNELAGLDFERVAELERFVHEGQFHHGPSSVLQVVARKP